MESAWAERDFFLMINTIVSCPMSSMLKCMHAYSYIDGYVVGLMGNNYSCFHHYSSFWEILEGAIYIYIYFPLLSWRHKPVKMISWTSGILAITVASYQALEGGKLRAMVQG